MGRISDDRLHVLYARARYEFDEAGDCGDVDGVRTWSDIGNALNELKQARGRVAELEAEVARLTANAAEVQAMLCGLPDMMLLLRLRSDGYKLTFAIDATAPGATHGARGMGSTVSEAVASLREQLGKLKSGASDEQKAT